MLGDEAGAASADNEMPNIATTEIRVTTITEPATYL
jgi:hypothetical protein